MKLSIIIPYWNAKAYTDELLDCLAPQITKNVEVILVDDGSQIPFKTRYKWCKVLRKKNGGCSTARNMGLDNATGDYISFIDADDLVPNYYVEKIFEKAVDGPDIIEFSWKSLTKEGTQHDYKLNNDNDKLTNPSVCTRVFKKAFIANVRFNPLKDSTEDEDFSRKIGYLDPDAKYKKAIISDYMYYYRTAVSDSKVKRFKKGLMNTKRVVFYYKHVTSDMTWLLKEIQKEDEKNEVWLLTEQNDIPELKKYCQISKPISIWGHEFRGENYSKFTKIDPPIKAQVILYCEFANKIGGIPTFLFNTSMHLKDMYDILVLYDRLDDIQVERLKSIVRVMKNDPSKPITCDTIILNRLTDVIPKNVAYKKSVQVCHACVQNSYRIPKDRDYLVNVSQAAKDSWGEESENGIVIHNMSYPLIDDVLLLVSATRMQAGDKGLNDNRIRTLANMLNEKDIPFLWLNFSDKGLLNPPKNFINMDARLNIQGFIQKADYLVQLSDREAYSMSILEALNLNTAVLATPFPSLFEEGFVDGKTGYVIPFDMNFDVEKILKVPRFNFKYDNKAIVKQWKEIIDMPAPERKNTVIPHEDLVKVKVITAFSDKYTGNKFKPGEATFTRKRVNEILKTQQEKNIKLIEVNE